MTQTWHDLLFAHWSFDPDRLRPRVPAELPLDLFAGRAWLGIVPFHMTSVAPRGIPAVPWLSAFPELNVRTYVHVHGKPGVYFFSLDATNPLAVALARTLHLPYYLASMNVETGDVIRYRSRRKHGPAAEFAATYRPEGPAFSANPGSLEYFLTERYCLYTLARRRRILRLEIHHPPWSLQHAHADFLVNGMSDQISLQLPTTDPLLHFSKRQDMVAWLPTRA
jgi:uncharacterized protein